MVERILDKHCDSYDWLVVALLLYVSRELASLEGSLESERIGCAGINSNT
jgi:hypothetical protein